MNWFKRIALGAGLLFAAGSAQAATSVFILNSSVSTTGQASPVATFTPGGQSCQLTAGFCTANVQAGQSLTISIALPAGLQVVSWGGLCAPAGTATSAVIMVPTQTSSAPNCSIIIRPATPPTPQTGWWWAPSESGSGYALAVNGDDRMFIAFFGYRDNGQPYWRISNAPRLTTAPSARVYRGPLQEMAGGGTLAGGERGNPQTVDASVEMTAQFSSATVGRLTLRNTVTGATQGKAIQRFPINGQAVLPSPDNAIWTGWYWDGANQPGVGYFIEQQGNQAFVASFAYDTTGAPIWYVTAGSVLPTAGGYQLNAPLNAFTGGSPFSATPPVNTPTTVPNGTAISNLARIGLSIQLSTGRFIGLGAFNW